MILELESRHPLPVPVLGGAVTLTVLSGDTVYYGATQDVSASSNYGSLTVGGGSVTLTAQVWVRTAGLSGLNVVASTPPQDVVLGNDGTVGGPGGTPLTGSAAGASWLLPSGLDDTAAINTANAAGQRLGVGTFKVSGVITGIPFGQTPSKTILQATNAAARIQNGPNLGTLPSADEGTYGGFAFDGQNLVTGAMLLLNTADTKLDPIVLINGLGDGLIVAGQNCRIDSPSIALLSGCGIVYDNGCGNNTIIKPQVSRCAQYHHESRQSAAPPVTAYAVPTYNHVINPQYEYGSGSNLGCYHQLAGSFNDFTSAQFYCPLDVSLVKLEPNTVGGRSGDANGRLYFRGPSVLSGNNTGIGVGIEANAVTGGVAGGLNSDVAVVFEGERIFSGLNVAQKWGASNPIWARGPITKYNVTTEFLTNGTGAYPAVLNVGLAGETFPDDIVVSRNEFVGGYQQIAKFSGTIGATAANLTRVITVDPVGDGSTIGRQLWLPDGTLKEIGRKDLPDFADLKSLYGAYRLAMPWVGGQAPQGSVTGTYILAPATIVAGPSNLSPLGMMYVDPADYTSNWGTLYYRVKAIMATNAVAPGVNFTFGLYPVATVVGGTNVNTLTLGTVVTGSTVLFTAPTLDTAPEANSGDFAAPAAGQYALACVISGTTATSSAEILRACLEVHRK